MCQMCEGFLGWRLCQNAKNLKILHSYPLFTVNVNDGNLHILHKLFKMTLAK